MSGPLDLFELAAEYLDACQQALDTTEGGKIGRAFVSPGMPAFDCPEQLTVHVGASAQADTLPLVPSLAPLHRLQTGIVVPLIVLTATVLRCAPTASSRGIPAADKLTEAAKVTFQDLWAIWNVVATMKRSEALWAPREREMIFDPAVPVNIQGGACGWQIPVRVQLGGYR